MIKYNKICSSILNSEGEVVGNALWGIWCGRNDCIFNNKDYNPLRTTNFILSSLFLWVSFRDRRDNISNWPACFVNPL